MAAKDGMGMDVPRVLITGLGAITPLGGTVAETWDALLAGRSGVRALHEDWATGLPVRIAAPVLADPAEHPRAPAVSQARPGPTARSGGRRGGVVGCRLS